MILSVLGRNTMLSIFFCIMASSLCTIFARESMKVIGAGFGRTGTASLHAALKSIGYKTHHMKEVFKNGEVNIWTDMFNGVITKEEFFEYMEKAGYNATTDYPGCLIYKDYLNRNSAAKVILSIRDSPDIWVKSVSGTIGSSSMKKIFSSRPMKWVFPSYENLIYHLWDKSGSILFDESGDMDGESAKAAYVDWIANIKKTVPSKQLLIHNAKEGWPPLCKFLNLEGNDCPSNRGEVYPNINDGEQMKKGIYIMLLITDWFDLIAGAGVGCIISLLLLVCWRPNQENLDKLKKAN